MSARIWHVTAVFAVDLEDGATAEDAIENAQAMVAEFGLAEFVDDDDVQPGEEIAG